jgi:hypothetical protein
MATVTPDDVTLTVWRNLRSGAQIAGPGRTVSYIDLTQSTGPADPGVASLTCPELWAQAGVKLYGAPGEHLDFFKFGFIQLKFVTDDWAHYRGQTPADGSVFFAADRPPARQRQLCRDNFGPVSLFYDTDQAINLLAPFVGQHAGFFSPGTTIPASGSISFTVDYFDSPQRVFDLIKQNNSFAPLPPRPNFLYSLQTGAAYATMFAVQRGHGKPIEALKTFQWNVRWRAHFGLDPANNVVQRPVRTGGATDDVTDMNVSHVVAGGPPNPPFQHFVTDPTLPTCNAVMQAAFDHPFLRTSQRWEDWEVRHPERSLYP